MPIVVTYVLNKNIYPTENIDDKTRTLHKYQYNDKNNKLQTVQMSIRKESDTKFATIDFDNVNQYKNFIMPDWMSVWEK